MARKHLDCHTANCVSRCFRHNPSCAGRQPHQGPMQRAKVSGGPNALGPADHSCPNTISSSKNGLVEGNHVFYHQINVHMCIYIYIYIYIYNICICICSIWLYDIVRYCTYVHIQSYLPMISCCASRFSQHRVLVSSVYLCFANRSHFESTGIFCGAS